MVLKRSLLSPMPGVEGHDAAGGFAEFDRVAGCFGIDGTNRIRADAHSELDR